MAIKKKLANDRDEHTRYLGSFRGVDFSSDPSEVADYRLAECVNMYKDYRSGQGQAIETIPGFRHVNPFKYLGEIFGLHVFQKGNEKVLYIHGGKKLYRASDLELQHTKTTWTTVYEDMNEVKSTSFIFNNRLYIMDGKNYLWVDGTETLANDATENAFVPTTYISLRPDGSPYKETENSGEYSQQNILTDKYKSTFVADGESKSFTMPLGTDIKAQAVSLTFGSTEIVEIGGDEYSIAEFPEDFTVMQYGIKLPWAGPFINLPSYIEYEERNGINVPIKAHTYPNAIVSISDEGVVTLAAHAPKPEDNLYGLDNEIPVIAPGDTPLKYAYPAGAAGIEIIVKKKIDTIKGITSSSEDIGSIIKGCRLSTVFGDRILISGNPEYPNIVFYNGRNPETGYSDPSYFGVLDWFSEGVTNTPITALMPIADTLMVLRADTAQDGSVSFRSRVETGEDVRPITYQGTAGLPGVGCLGACCNFLDDPIFISRHGVEAMGQLSARFERAIEHRSFLIDGKLLNLDLSKASITEFDGYLVLLIDGEIFLADSRQRYTHESGVMNYEWYYLRDIGIYRGQWNERVFADPELTEDIYIGNGPTKTKLVSIEEVKKLTDVSRNVGGRLEAVLPEDIPSLGDVANKDANTSFSSSDLYDAYGNPIVYQTIYFEPFSGKDSEGKLISYSVYTVRTGANTGGTFDPAIVIKAVDHDKLVFGTRTGAIGCFNFDKRDPADDYKIPVDLYTFNARTIECGLATKMDNCGVPHLTKSTVKKSMVVKMRTFEHSSAEVKVRTNRNPMQEVERLIGGRFGFEGLDLADLSYVTGEKNLFRVREKEKKWVEKQLYFISREYKRPFALHYVTYGYVIAGRYKD